MHRRSLKLKVMAALFSAAFLLGAVDAGAYTYDGITMDISKKPTDQPIYDNTDLVIKNSTINWTEIDCEARTILNKGDVIAMGANARWVSQSGGSGYATAMLPVYVTEETAKWISENLGLANRKTIVDLFGNEITCKTDNWETITYTYNNGKVTWYFACTEGDALAEEGDEVETYPYTKYYSYAASAVTTTGILQSENSDVRVYENIKADEINIIGNTTVSAGGKATAKAINVTGNSRLVASGTITGGYIYSDKNIATEPTTTDTNYSVVGSNITSTGTLKSDLGIGAWSGAIRAKNIQAGSWLTGEVSVTAGGKVTAKALNVGKINASGVTLTGAQKVGGKYDLAKQAKLNGGVSLNKKKIAGLAKGTISSTSKDLVNGAQLYTIKGRISSPQKLSAGKDVSISSADAISVNKAGKVTAKNTGIVTGNTVYTITEAIQSSLNGVTSLAKKNATSIISLQNGMADLKKSVANINSAVASTTKNLSLSLSNRLQADLGNLSDDGKSVIKNLIAETLKSMNFFTASVASNNEASLNTDSISAISIMPTTVDAVETVNLNAASVTSADIDNVYDTLDGKVGKTDFAPLKTDVGSNTTAITTNTEGIKANASAIDALKTSKANANGSNLDVTAYSAKLGTGKIEKDSVGLVNGGAVYNVLDQKADKAYVDAGLGMMSKQLDFVKQATTRDMNRMGANAAALASLHPLDYDPEDKLDFAAGYGHYHDSNATAVGAFYRPNASTMVSLAGTVGNGDSMVSAGISFKPGMNANVEKVMISKDDFNKQQVENRVMKGHLDNQTARLQQMEAALSAMISR